MVDEVAGHQVDGAFDPLERPADPPRQRLQERRLADPHVAFEQDVSACEGGDQQQVDGPFLAGHDPVGARFEPQRPVAPCLGPVHRFDPRFDDEARPGSIGRLRPGYATPRGRYGGAER